jgi:hypothetical protein
MTNRQNLGVIFRFGKVRLGSVLLRQTVFKISKFSYFQIFKKIQNDQIFQKKSLRKF